MLAGVMFPLWPSTMRLGVWYLSIACLGLVGLFFAIAIVRLIFYIVSVLVASPGIWIFPKLFADVGFVSRVSHLPLYQYANLVVGGIIYSTLGMGPPQEEIEKAQGQRTQVERSKKLSRQTFRKRRLHRRSRRFW
jgi:hypothetical protein